MGELFRYTGMDSAGREVTGRVEAENTSDAIRLVREMGYFPTELKVANPMKIVIKRPVQAPAPALAVQGDQKPAWKRRRMFEIVGVEGRRFLRIRVLRRSGIEIGLWKEGG